MPLKCIGMKHLTVRLNDIRTSNLKTIGKVSEIRIYSSFYNVISYIKQLYKKTTLGFETTIAWFGKYFRFI